MGCLLWPFNLIITMVRILDRLNDVDDETEKLREIYGNETARRYKRQMYLGLSIRFALSAIGLVAIVIFVIYLMFFSPE